MLVTNDGFFGKVARSGYSKNPGCPIKLWFFARAALFYYFNPVVNHSQNIFFITHKTYLSCSVR